MWLSPVSTGSTSAWISLADAKAFLRVDGEDEDSLIFVLIDAAQAAIEAQTGLKLFTQTATLHCSEWSDLARLPIGPVRSIEAITYEDGTATQTLDGWRVFGLRTLRTGIDLTTRPPVASYQDAIAVNLTVGLCDFPSDLPGDLYRALLLTLGDFYTYREDTIAERSVAPTVLPTGVQAMLANWRVY